MPDPRDAAAAWASAVARGDASAAHAMLSDRSRRALRPEDVARRLAEDREEIGEQARGVASPSATVRSVARVRFADGEDASLELEGGAFRVAAADALPAVARTPEQALAELRRVLARRSYAGLMRLLLPASRSVVESDLRSLVDGLSHPEGLVVHISGDVASVEIAGGHAVRLRREGGVWRVEDFD